MPGTSHSVLRPSLEPMRRIELWSPDRTTVQAAFTGTDPQIDHFFDAHQRLLGPYDVVADGEALTFTEASPMPPEELQFTAPALEHFAHAGLDNPPNPGRFMRKLSNLGVYSYADLLALGSNELMDQGTRQSNTADRVGAPFLRLVSRLVRKYTGHIVHEQPPYPRDLTAYFTDITLASPVVAVPHNEFVYSASGFWLDLSRRPRWVLRDLLDEPLAVPDLLAHGPELPEYERHNRQHDERLRQFSEQIRTTLVAPFIREQRRLAGLGQAPRR